ncbi:Ig-like domain-containing protein [Pectobacterium carotovorum]|nr:Ig-like domain-containing protein [Pectobacterium carotovorum]
MIDAITDAVTSLTANTTTALADNFTPVVFTATVKNSNDHPVANSTVSFTNTSGTLSQQTTTTNANGEATVSLTSLNVGNITVTAKVNGSTADAGKSATVAFIADAATAKVNTLTANPEIAPADNRTPIIFTAIVKDSYGHFASGLSVSFTTTGGSLNHKTVTTNASGQASVRLTSEKMGDITVTAKAQNSPANADKSATVSFIADVTTATVTDIKPSDGSTTANFRPIPITATVEDNLGHLVPNVDVRFTTTLGNISPKIATTKANGQAIVNLSGGTAGNAIVTAKVNNNANDTGKNTMVTFIPDIDRPIPAPE